MVEIIIAVYFISFLLSLSLVAWNYWALVKELRSESLGVLNANLKKIGYFWSLAQENFARLEKDSIEKDVQAAKRSTLMLGLLSLGSAVGFFLLLAITLAMRILKPQRHSRAIFQSDLAKDRGLPPSEVSRLYQELSQTR